MNKAEFSKYFKAFGDANRLAILELLAMRDMSVQEITSRVKLTQSAVSRHLGVLRTAEVVIATRAGQNVIYSLNRENVAVCCGGFCDCLQVVPKVPGDSENE